MDYAILYGAGNQGVKESKAVKDARQTIKDFFGDKSLTISERYDFYLALVDMFSKAPGLAYKMISDNIDGSEGNPRKILHDALAQFNGTYGKKYGEVNVPSLTNKPPVETKFYSDLAEFKSKNADTLKQLFGEDATDKFDAYIDANFKVAADGENKGKYSKDLLTAMVSRLNNPTNYYYGSIISQFAGVPTSGKWTFGSKSVSDYGNAGKVDLYKLLPIYTGEELLGAASNLLQTRIEAIEMAGLLGKIDPKSDTDEQAQARVEVLVKAGFFSKITEQQYDELEKPSKQQAFEWNDKYYQLTDAGRAAITRIDSSYKNASALVVEQVEDGLDERLVSKKGVPDEDYQWLGNLLLFAKNQAMATNETPYWVKGSKKLGIDGQANLYTNGLSSLPQPVLEQPEYKPTTILELALYNSRQQSPDLALQNALLYKNRNKQTPRTSQELQELLTKLSGVELNSQKLVDAITKIDNPQQTQENNTGNAMQKFNDNLLGAFNLLTSHMVIMDPYVTEDKSTLKPEYANGSQQLPEKVKQWVNLRNAYQELLSKYYETNGTPKQGVAFLPADDEKLVAAMEAFINAPAIVERREQLQNLKTKDGILDAISNFQSNTSNIIVVGTNSETITEAKKYDSKVEWIDGILNNANKKNELLQELSKTIQDPERVLADFLKDVTAVGELRNNTTEEQTPVLLAASILGWNATKTTGQGDYENKD